MGLIREVVPGIFRSPLPTVRMLREFAAAGGRAVVDLTQRPRDAEERGCARLGLEYQKVPTAYVGGGGDLGPAVECILSAPRPVLFHCFHGRDRTGLVARRVVMREVGSVWLYRVGRNLNRAVRTCEAFGVRRLVLVQCDGARVEGRLYGAAGRVVVERAEALPARSDDLVALETWGQPLGRVEWEGVRAMVIGGETTGLPRNGTSPVYRIPMAGAVSGLTVEGALAVGLYAWGGAC